MIGLITMCYDVETQTLMTIFGLDLIDLMVFLNDFIDKLYSEMT